MSEIANLYWSNFDLYSNAISSRTSIGALNRTAVLKEANIECYFTKLTGDEAYRYGKQNIISTHRLFCDIRNIKSTDIIYIKGRWYAVSWIDRCNRMSHHVEVLLLAIHAPQLMGYSSSSSSISQSYSSSSSSLTESLSSATSTSSMSSSSVSSSSNSSSSSTSQSSESSTSSSSSTLVESRSTSSSNSTESESSYGYSSSSSSLSTPSSISSSSSSYGYSSDSSLSSLSSSSLEFSSSSSTSSLEFSSSSSSSYGYCADDIYAEGFNVAAYNGTYSVAGEFDEKPYWVNENGMYLYWSNSVASGTWVMYTELNETLAQYLQEVPTVCPYGSGCAQWSANTKPYTPAGIICDNEISSSSVSTSSSLSSVSMSSLSSESSSTSSFGMSSSDSSSSSAYCIEMIYAEGFSTAAYNGTYNVGGEFNDRQYWFNENMMYIYWSTASGTWLMYSELNNSTALYKADSITVCPYGFGCSGWLLFDPPYTQEGTVCDSEISSSSVSESSSSSIGTSSSESSSSSISSMSESSSSSKSESSISESSSSSSSKSESSSSSKSESSSSESTNSSSSMSVSTSSSTSSITESLSSSSSSNIVKCALLHYKMNDNAANTTVVDSVGTSNGTVAVDNTSTMTQTGKINSSLQFDATADTIIDSNYVISEQSFTISFWWYRVAGSYFDHIVGCAQSSAVQQGWIIYDYSAYGDKIGCYISKNNAWYNVGGGGLKATVTTTAAQWYLIQLTYNASTGLLSFFIDGVANNTQDQSADKVVTYDGGTLHISWPNNYPTYGRVDDFRFYNSVLSLDELREIWNNGNGTEKDCVDESTSSSSYIENYSSSSSDSETNSESSSSESSLY